MAEGIGGLTPVLAAQSGQRSCAAVTPALFSINMARAGGTTLPEVPRCELLLSISSAGGRPGSALC